MALGNIVNASALDLDVTSQVPFPRLINFTPDETVVLAWIAFSRERIVMKSTPRS